MDQLICPQEPLLENAKNANYSLLLNKRLRALRKSHGYTLAEMGKFLGVAFSTYAGYEAREDQPNYRIPSIEKIVRLAAFFGVSVDYLIGYSENKYKNDQKDVFSLLEMDPNMDDHLKALIKAELSKYRAPELASAK